MTINYKAFNYTNEEKLTEKEWNKDVTKHYRKVKELLEEITNKTEVISNEQFEELLNNNYKFSLVLKNDNPYFHKDCYLVALYFSYCSSKPVTVYINKEYYNQITGNEVTEEVVNSIEETEVPAIETTNNETYYTVGNTSFKHLYQAEEYCNNHDFEYTLIKEIGNNNNTIKPLNIKHIYWYEYKLRGFSPFCQPKGFIEHDPTIGRHGIIAYDRPLTDNEIDEYELQPHHALFKAV